MKLLRTVSVKHVLTEEKKKNMLKEFDRDVLQIEREIEQLKFQLHKATKDVTIKHDKLVFRKGFTKEIETRQERLQSIAFKIQQLHKLKLGTEIKEGSIEAIVDVRIGDRWLDESEQNEIIIKDGIVHEIREGRNEDD